MNPKRDVLIVGGNGFIGHEISQLLNSNGYDVKILTRSRSKQSEFPQIIGDLFDENSYKSILEKLRPSVVINCAWISQTQSYRDSPANLLYLEGSKRFAYHCFENGINHYIGIGSSAEYGKGGDSCVAGVTTPLPIDLYGKTKLECQTEVNQMANSAGTRFSWLRVFQAYGLSQDKNRLIPSAIITLQKNEEFVLSAPESRHDWISTKDIASAVKFNLENDLPEVIDLGTGIGTSNLKVAETIATLLNVNTNKIMSEIQQEYVSEDLFVGKDSPLLKAGWLPSDTLISGIGRLILQ